MESSRRGGKTIMFFLILVSGMCVYHAYVNAENADPRSMVNSREFKILLKPELFINRNDGFEKVLICAKEAANELGVKLLFKPRGAMYAPKFRRIVFYDTPDFSLRKKGYALRKRVKYKNRSFQDDFELMLKFRNSDPSAAGRVDTSAAGYLASVSKFEQDIAVALDPNTKAYAMKFLYSRSTKLKDMRGDFRTVEEFAKIFPALRGLGLPLNTPLAPVRGVDYLELKIEPAKLLYFGEGLTCEFDISIWYRGETNTPMIAEISYDYEIDDYPGKMKSAAVVLSEKFYMSLQKKLREKDFRHTGTTKMAFVYGTTD